MLIFEALNLYFIKPLFRLRSSCRRDNRSFHLWNRFRAISQYSFRVLGSIYLTSTTSLFTAFWHNLFPLLQWSQAGWADIESIHENDKKKSYWWEQYVVHMEPTPLEVPQIRIIEWVERGSYYKSINTKGYRSRQGHKKTSGLSFDHGQKSH